MEGFLLADDQAGNLPVDAANRNEMDQWALPMIAERPSIKTSIRQNRYRLTRKPTRLLQNTDFP